MTVRVSATTLEGDGPCRFHFGLSLGLVAGAAAGAVAGLILAPKTGKETRQIVAARAHQVLQKAREYLGSVLQRIGTELAPQGAEEDSDNHVEVAGS